MNQPLLSPDDVDDLIGLIRANYGYDFSEYARASFGRRILRCMDNAGLATVYDLKYSLTNNPAFFAWFLQSLTVNVTEMFRDPPFYRALRESVLPVLASYPTLRIWHAGCSTGEEVFSMAIWLHEVGLLERTRIYATDLNPANLERARQGLVPLVSLKEYAQNYEQAGGQCDFTTYYTIEDDYVRIRSDLRRSVVFSQHNLVTDQIFNEFHLICCRNVLIYFSRPLQDRVVQLFHDSLSALGYLALGLKESLLFTSARPQFEAVAGGAKIFRRKH